MNKPDIWPLLWMEMVDGREQKIKTALMVIQKD